MPDLPTPKDAAEAALFSECWDAVLSYADLCTSGSTAANQLAREAFALGIREARAAEDGTARNAGRRSSRLPRIPLLLTAVRTTAAAWEAAGPRPQTRPRPAAVAQLRQGRTLHGAAPEPSHRSARACATCRSPTPPCCGWRRSRRCRCTPSPAAQGLDPTAAVEELNEVRGLFGTAATATTSTPRWTRSAAATPGCWTRSPARPPPTPPRTSPGTSPRCVECAEAAACLRLHGRRAARSPRAAA